jgi:hypothetical protein
VGVTVTMAGSSGRDRNEGMLCSEAGLVALEDSLAHAAREGGERAALQFGIAGCLACRLCLENCILDVRTGGTGKIGMERSVVRTRPEGACADVHLGRIRAGVSSSIGGGALIAAPLHLNGDGLTGQGEAHAHTPGGHGAL